MAYRPPASPEDAGCLSGKGKGKGKENKEEKRIISRYLTYAVSGIVLYGVVTF